MKNLSRLTQNFNFKARRTLSFAACLLIALGCKSPGNSSSLLDKSKSKKVVVFYASMGSGHLSASKAIAAEVEAKYPGTEVELKDIREFYRSKAQEKISRELFWFTVKNYPNVFSNAYTSTMEKNNQAPSLDKSGNPYDLERVSEYLKVANPDVIVSTHYGTSIVLSSLKNRKLINPEVKIGWLHTDYCEACFPRISKNVDMTFLPHEKLEEIWSERGVLKEMMQPTGMPLNPKLFEPIHKEQYLRDHGFNPEVPTITLASGAEGVGNFPEIARQIAKAFGDKPVQFFVATAKSEKNRAGLEALRPTLPANFKMVVEGMVPQEHLLNMIKSSDLYITKAGGLSPTEGFAINVPMILLDIYGGHEHENAVLFDKLELASITDSESKVAEKIESLLTDPEYRKRMIAAQKAFRGSLDVDRIVEFAVSGRKDLSEGHAEFEVAKAKNVAGSFRHALTLLDKSAIGNVEILMGDSVDKGKNGIGKGYFSSVALRVGESVILQSEATKQVSIISYQDYLHSNSTNLKQGLVRGIDYGLTGLGNVAGLRLDGFSSQQIIDLNRAMESVTAENNGKSNPTFPNCRCQSVVAEVLARSGFKPPTTMRGLYAGLDYFDHYFKQFSENAKYGVEMISYARNFNSGQNDGITISRSPVSLFKPLKMFKTIFQQQRYDPIFGKRVISYSGKNYVYMENLDFKSDTEIKERLKKERASLEAKRTELLQMEANLKTVYAEYRAQKGGEYVNAVNSTGQDIQTQDAVRQRTQDFYDDFIQKKLEYTIDQSHQKVQELYEEYRKRAPPGSADRLNKLFTKILSNYTSYKENMDLYGSPKDVQRISAQRAFYKNFQSFMSEVDTIEGNVEQQSFIQRIRSILIGTWNNVVLAAKVLPVVGKILYSLQFQTTTKSGQTPLIDNVYEAFNKLGEILKLRVEYKGLLNLSAIQNGPKTVNVYALQHSHPQLDNILLAKMMKEKIRRKFAVFGASDYFGFPKFIADRFNINDSFITVGRGSDLPIEKSVEILRTKGLNDLVIFPEGSVSAGLYDNRPLRSKFAWGLIQRLQTEGYKVNIIPVAFPKNFTFNTALPKGDGLDLQVQVLEPITDAKIREVVQKTGDWEALNRLIRSGYLEALDVGNSEFLGMKDIDVIEKDLQLRSSCNTLSKGMP